MSGVGGLRLRVEYMSVLDKGLKFRTGIGHQQVAYELGVKGCEEGEVGRGGGRPDEVSLARQLSVERLTEGRMNDG